jgi:hypothetical protein
VRRPLALAVALALPPGCRGDEAPPPPDPALVEALVEAHLAAARAEADRADGDSARRAALAAHGVEAPEVGRTLDRLAREPEAAAALWAAVAARLDAERMGLAAPEPDSHEVRMIR